MSKLKCNERSCKHNCCMSCTKQSIVLDDDAICASYQRRNCDVNEEFASEKYPDYSDMETSINCNEESCYYNNDNCCKASEVKIDSDAWCSTYRKK